SLKSTSMRAFLCSWIHLQEAHSPSRPRRKLQSWPAGFGISVEECTYRFRLTKGTPPITQRLGHAFLVFREGPGGCGRRIVIEATTVASSVSQGGSCQTVSSTKAARAMAKSAGVATALVQTGWYSAAPRTPTAAALLPAIRARAPAWRR